MACVSEPSGTVSAVVFFPLQSCLPLPGSPACGGMIPQLPRIPQTLCGAVTRQLSAASTLGVGARVRERRGQRSARSSLLLIPESRARPYRHSTGRDDMPKTPQHSSRLHRVGAKSPATGEFYSRVFEQSPVPMWVVDAATLTFVAVNDAAVRDSGHTRPQLLGLTVPALCAILQRGALTT
jgi:PAS domain-containing protein